MSTPPPPPQTQHASLALKSSSSAIPHNNSPTRGTESVYHLHVSPCLSVMPLSVSMQDPTTTREIVNTLNNDNYWNEILLEST